jgi:spoIIIJ-associated protein
LKLAAETAAEKVRHTGQPFSFAPMSSRERRMLHLAFRAYDDLATSSTGEGIHRFVVAHPKGYDTGKFVAPVRRSSPGGRGSRR